jgi:hypothetical protein
LDSLFIRKYLGKVEKLFHFFDMTKVYVMLFHDDVEYFHLMPQNLEKVFLLNIFKDKHRLHQLKYLQNIVKENWMK